MSLKAFHRVFISLAAALMLGFAGWAVREWLASGKISSLALGTVGFASGALLVFYLFRVTDKLPGTASPA